MKFFSLILIALGLCVSSMAQDDCPEYGRLMKEAESFFIKKDYRNALYKYNSAKTCSPSRRKEVDERINQMFEKINNDRKKAEKDKETIKRLQEKDSSDFADNFIEKNKNLVDTVLSASEKKQLLNHVEILRKKGFGSSANSLAVSLLLLQQAKDYRDLFVNLYQKELKITEPLDFFKTRSAISHTGYIVYDTYYYWALEKLSQAMNLLPDLSRVLYSPKIRTVSDTLLAHRKYLEQTYWLADTVIDLYEKVNFTTLPCSDNQNFIWSYATTSFEDYKKRQLRFLNLSVSNFTYTTDSLIQLVSKGSFDSILAADTDYRFMVVKKKEYSLNKNLFDFEKITYLNPPIIKLIDKNGRELNDFSFYDTSAYFFSPDGNFLATWKTWANNSFELILYNLKTQTFWKLPNSHRSATMSFSSDSKRMIYYNDSTQSFYFFDLIAKKSEIISSFSPEIPGIHNIDFTGNSDFLKINTLDKIILYDVVQKKIRFQFQNDLVKNIIVAPNNKEMLIICKRKGNSNGFLSYCTDMSLKIKDKLYSDCENYFYTPDGKYIVAYDSWNIMRWNTKKDSVKNPLRASIGLAELLGKSGVPFNYFENINDATQIEKGARQFYDNGIKHKETFEDRYRPKLIFDSILAVLYLKQSQLLFDRLKIGDAQNMQNDRIPFVLDWSNHIRRHLGDRDFYQQFSSQQLAVEKFDNLLNSADSIYPKLLYYAANSYMLLIYLLDSLKTYNSVYIDVLKKEISLRENVFSKDPDDVHYNNAYLDIAFQKLASGYLYFYASNRSENIHALDSAIYYADKNIESSSTAFDKAYFMVIKANAFLFQDNGLPKAFEIYEKILRDFPEYRKENIFLQLQFLRELKADEAKISKAEEFIKKY